MNRPPCYLSPRSVILATTFAVLASVTPPSVRAVPELRGAASPGPPRALRTMLVLDKETLEKWGIGRPARLAFDADGALYVMDPARRRLVKVSPEGRFLHEVTVSGEDPGALAQPSDVVVDVRGSVLVLDRGAGALLAYDKNGALLATQPIAPELIEEARDPRSSLLLDSFGRLWLLAPRERDLVRLDQALRRDRAGRFLTPEDSVGVPSAAASLPNGETWIADPSSGSLRRFRASGALAGAVALADSGGPAWISALATDHAGFVFAADVARQRIVILGPDGSRTFERALGGDLVKWRPRAIAWSPLDRVAIADPDRGEVQILAVEREHP